VAHLINRDKLTQAILDADVSGMAKEEGSRLVEAWLEKLPTFPEAEWLVKFVEAPFFIQLQPKTYIVGQLDACFNAGSEVDGDQFVLGEWKSRRAPKLKKDGTNYQGDDREGWLEEITNGPQLGVYALAGREGTFLPQNPNSVELGQTLATAFHLAEPHILVRAAVKSNPVELWEGQFTFPGAMLDVVKQALLSEAEGIRARRKAGFVPFTIPGIHCTNMYRRTCEHHEDCLKRIVPPLEPQDWHPTDPGFVVPRLLGLDRKDPDLVVLSASALDSNYWCAEKGRRDYDHGHREEDFNLSVGTVLHTGLREIYSQLKIASGV